MQLHEQDSHNAFFMHKQLHVMKSQLFISHMTKPVDLQHNQASNIKISPTNNSLCMHNYEQRNFVCNIGCALSLDTSTWVIYEQSNTDTRYIIATQQSCKTRTVARHWNNTSLHCEDTTSIQQSTHLLISQRIHVANDLGSHLSRLRSSVLECSLHNWHHEGKRWCIDEMNEFSVQQFTQCNNCPLRGILERFQQYRYNSWVSTNKGKNRHKVKI